MLRITAILVPTDFSAASRLALRYACDFADELGAALHLLHVVQTPPTPSAVEMYAPLPETILDDLERRARADLETQLSQERRDRYAPKLVVTRGAPAREILEYLNQHRDIGLVVMATAGRRGVARLVLGSVAEDVVRNAPCPVLMVHPPDGAETDTGRHAA